MSWGVKLVGPGFNVDDYVGNFRKLYLHFALYLSGQPVCLDNAHGWSDLEVQIQLHGLPHPA
jgi:hypothetical protein